MGKNTWSKKNWDKSIDKAEAVLKAQCPEANCNVWLTGSAYNGTDYCDNLQLNVRVEFEYSIEKYYIPLTAGVQEVLKNTDDYMMLAVGAAIKSINNLMDKV
jgi:hypothetical protein